MRLRRTLAALTAATLALTGCGNDTPISPQSVGPAATSAAQKAPAPPAVPLDATAVLMKLNAAKIGLTHGAVQDEDTDPNDLLGRPNGYTSRASADLPGGDSEAEKYGIDRGLVIEVWPTADDAERRSKFIQDTLKSMQLLGTEYHYRADKGRALVRVSGKVKPSQAKMIETAVAGL
ncbi:hypothetical protein [Micromonospora aurantiaca (nom. illeg.)]|uniref:hypothetical protein n=1 Tax=Micromonospora aurantiaca (nom. illeg.) TaxID=47850 RepID=UPI003F49C39A